MLYLIHYVLFGLAEGDWMNDWLTHLPDWSADLIVLIVSLAS